jgi:hypothetical protein
VIPLSAVSLDGDEPGVAYYPHLNAMGDSIKKAATATAAIADAPAPAVIANRGVPRPVVPPFNNSLLVGKGLEALLGDCQGRIPLSGGENSGIIATAATTAASAATAAAAGVAMDDQVRAFERQRLERLAAYQRPRSKGSPQDPPSLTENQV